MNLNIVVFIIITIIKYTISCVGRLSDDIKLNTLNNYTSYNFKLILMKEAIKLHENKRGERERI